MVHHSIHSVLEVDWNGCGTSHNTWIWLSRVEKILLRLWNYCACHAKAGVTFAPERGSHSPLNPLHRTSFRGKCDPTWFRGKCDPRAVNQWNGYLATTTLKKNMGKTGLGHYRNLSHRNQPGASRIWWTWQAHYRVQIPHVTGLKKLVNFPKICSCTISKNVINNSTTFENFIPSASPEKTCGFPGLQNWIWFKLTAKHATWNTANWPWPMKRSTQRNTTFRMLFDKVS